MIHFFTKGDISGATARYRGFLVAKELNLRGYETLVHEPPRWRPFFELSRARLKELQTNFKALLSVGSGDIIYLVRTVYQYDFFLLIVLFKIIFRKKIIFDFDDPIYLRNGLKSKMIILTKLADAVIIGSHHLAEWAAKYNKNVFIIPTSVPLEKYSNHTKIYRESGEFVIGWLGNAPAHRENLKNLIPVFQELINRGLKFKFILVGSLGDKKIYDIFRRLDGLNIQFVDSIAWENPEIIASQIQKFDIGLMPLLDTEWNRGKCAFKAIEYMACGVVPIVSPIGENVFLVQDGENGFLAKTAEDWTEKIKNLYENKECLQLVGRKAQLTIKNNYSFSANIPKIMAIINAL